MDGNKTLRQIVLIGLSLSAAISVVSAPMFASTVAVGSCQPTKVSFPTIQQAVNAASPGTTVSVCPGSYPEQVMVNKKLILKGFTSGNQGAAIVTSPVGGMVQNATGIYGDPIEAQLFVTGPGITVTVSDLTFDAANSNLDALGCNGDPVGIYFQNASGTITRNSVRNDVLSPSLTGCQGGLGILAESTGTDSVTITFNNVETYQKNGITVDGFGAPGLTTAITSNTIIGQGPTGGAAENSIQLAYGATGSIGSNTLGSDVWTPDVFGDTGDAAAGILVYDSPSVSITSNNVSETQYGIVVESDGSESADNAQITTNVISATHFYDAIDLCNSSNSNVTGNKINGADESGVHVDNTCGNPSLSNTVKSNTINSTCAGVLSGPASGNTISPNTYYNTANLVLTGVDTCTPAPVRGGKRMARAHGRVRPVRP